MVEGRKLSACDEWNSSMQMPTGQFVRSQQMLERIPILGIQSELEIRTSTKLIKIARAIARIKRAK